LAHRYWFVLLLHQCIQKIVVNGNDTSKVGDFSKIKSEEVYLPKGTDWIDFWTGEKFNGGQIITKETPIDIMPLFIRSGSILPIGPKVQYATEKRWDNLEIRIYPGADGKFILYEDENDNYNYEKGIYSTITFKWDDSEKTLIIGDREGSFPGMLETRTFKIVLVSKEQGIGFFVLDKISSVVKYNGSEMKITVR
jgi:alpha-D-xyloside xylohydrolase